MKPTFVSEMRSQKNRLINKYFHYEEITILDMAPDILPILNFNATYILYAEKKIIYIGSSIEVGNRILSHLKRKTEIFGTRHTIPPFGHEITGIKIIPFRSYEYAEALESFLIHKIRPKYNYSNKVLFSSLYRFPIPEKEMNRIEGVIRQTADDLKQEQKKARNRLRRKP